MNTGPRTPPGRMSILRPVGAVLFLLLSGCVTEPSPRERSVPPPPADARATSVQIFAAAPRDTDTNGFGDMIAVTVYLFDEQRYPLPIALPGRMRFDLRDPGGATLASWSFDETQTAQAAQPLAPGPGYRFDLSIIERARDDHASGEALLWARFLPRDGPEVSSAGGVALRLGRVLP